jgi:hypothetical protein
MTPLANIPFNFGNFASPTGFPYVPQSGAGGLPPPPMFAAGGFQQQQQQSYQPQYQPGQNMYQNPAQVNSQSNGTAAPAMQPPFNAGAWAGHPAIAAALQRQAEEQRRNQGS